MHNPSLLAATAKALTAATSKPATSAAPRVTLPALPQDRGGPVADPQLQSTIACPEQVRPTEARGDEIDDLPGCVQAHLTPLGEPFPQAFARALDAGLGPRQAQADAPCVLVLRHALKVAQSDGLAVLGAQLGQHAWQAGGQAVDHSDFLRLGRQILGEIDQVARQAQAIRHGIARDLE